MARKQSYEKVKVEKYEIKQCSICNKNINFSFGCVKGDWVYKTSNKGYTKYQCSYSCMRHAQKKSSKR